MNYQSAPGRGCWATGLGTVSMAVFSSAAKACTAWRVAWRVAVPALLPARRSGLFERLGFAGGHNAVGAVLLVVGKNEVGELLPVAAVFAFHG